MALHVPVDEARPDPVAPRTRRDARLALASLWLSVGAAALAIAAAWLLWRALRGDATETRAVPAARSEFECVLRDADVECVERMLRGELRFERVTAARLEAHARRHGWRLGGRTSVVAVVPPGRCAPRAVDAIAARATAFDAALDPGSVALVGELLSRNGRHADAEPLFARLAEHCVNSAEPEVATSARFDAELAAAYEALLLGRAEDCATRLARLRTELREEHGRRRATSATPECGFCATPWDGVRRGAELEELALRAALVRGDFEALRAASAQGRGVLQHAFVFDGDDVRALVGEDTWCRALAEHGFGSLDELRAGFASLADGDSATPLAEARRDIRWLLWRVLRADERELASAVGALVLPPDFGSVQQHELADALVASGRDFVGATLAAWRAQETDEVTRRVLDDRYDTWLVFRARRD
ncbi:MAG: hypothetical protein L6Q99_17885 [Planctomycetes bacterium]|nr:hypothetical protein [Planctomycetota bacterium]